MQQRKSATGSGRPSGTDGSDFSYRMVVDSRYTKVAKGKSHLCRLIAAQGIVQLLGGLSFLISTLKQETADVLVVLSTIIGFLALFIGELGRRSSKVSLLKLYMFASSIAILISIACVIRNNFLVEAIQDSSHLGAHKFELLKIAAVLLGVVVQTLSIRTTVSLVGNMSPPKRAS